MQRSARRRRIRDFDARCAALLSRAAGGVVDSVGRKPAMLVGMAAIAISDAGTALARDCRRCLWRASAGVPLAHESGERAFLSDLAQRA